MVVDSELFLEEDDDEIDDMDDETDADSSSTTESIEHEITEMSDAYHDDSPSIDSDSSDHDIAEMLRHLVPGEVRAGKRSATPSSPKGSPTRIKRVFRKCDTRVQNQKMQGKGGRLWGEGSSQKFVQEWMWKKSTEKWRLLRCGVRGQG
jgi:hypothetical protein